MHTASEGWSIINPMRQTVNLPFVHFTGRQQIMLHAGPQLFDRFARLEALRDGAGVARPDGSAPAASPTAGGGRCNPLHTYNHIYILYTYIAVLMQQQRMPDTSRTPHPHFKCKSFRPVTWPPGPGNAATLPVLIMLAIVVCTYQSPHSSGNCVTTDARSSHEKESLGQHDFRLEH